MKMETVLYQEKKQRNGKMFFHGNLKKEKINSELNIKQNFVALPNQKANCISKSSKSLRVYSPFFFIKGI